MPDVCQSKINSKKDESITANGRFQGRSILLASVFTKIRTKHELITNGTSMLNLVYNFVPFLYKGIKIILIWPT